jgi:hypothetical protein
MVGVPVADIGRKNGINHTTYFNRKKKHDGMTPDFQDRHGHLYVFLSVRPEMRSYPSGICFLGSKKVLSNVSWTGNSSGRMDKKT